MARLVRSSSSLYESITLVRSFSSVPNSQKHMEIRDGVLKIEISITRKEYGRHHLSRSRRATPTATLEPSRSFRSYRIGSAAHTTNLLVSLGDTPWTIVFC